MQRPKILVFASGTTKRGGSGFENLVRESRAGVLDAEIVGVVSNHDQGGVRKRAKRLEVPFTHFPAPYGEKNYKRIAAESGADFFALSGWLKRVFGLNPQTTFNIHPGPLPQFGGEDMYGSHVHEAVMAAFRNGNIRETALCMHFVTADYDRGPVFFRLNLGIETEDTALSIGARVRALEHRWQPIIANLVVHRQISWNGVNSDSLKYPAGYEIERHE